MQLLYSPMSPFARKVRVIAFELGLAERLALTLASPFTDESVRAINPLSKIPVLILDDRLTPEQPLLVCDCCECDAV